MGERVVERAETFARFWHRGQTYDGAPYADAHLASVVALLADADELTRATAWLHDVVEDTDAEPADLEAAGLADAVPDVVMLTRKDETYTAYIDRLAKSASPVAIAVKCADLACNIRAAHLDGYLDMAVRRWQPALDRLSVAPVGGDSDE